MKFKQNKILLEVFILKGSKTQVCQPRQDPEDLAVQVGPTEFLFSLSSP